MNNKIPTGWKKYRLGEVATIVGGGTPSTYIKEYWDGDIPWITPKDLSNLHGRYISKGERNISQKGLKNSSAKILPPGTVLLTTRAPVGKVAIASNEIATNQGFRSLIPSDKVDSDFLYYLLVKNVKYLESQATGTTFKELPGSVLKSLVFLFPPLPEQRAIASIFPPIEDKIELLRQENETLEAMAETIFKQWFIKDPENKEVLLKDIYVFEKGFEPGSSNYLETEEDNTIRFIRLKDMDNKNSSIFIKKSLAKNICVPDDLLVAFDGSPGKIGFGIEGAFSSGIRKVYSIHETYNNVWLKYLIFKSKPIQNTIKTYSTGTIIQHAGSCIDKLTFKFPEESKIKEFNELITPIFIKIQQNKQQIQTLTQLFDTLLRGLMSGKLRVDDALCQS